jgi:hypothetical protein
VGASSLAPIALKELLRSASQVPHIRCLCVALLAVASTGDTALAQATAQPCFEVMAARPGVEPAVPILVDKCSGRSWVLTRNGKNYRWSLIATELEKPKLGDRAPIEGAAVAPGTGPQKCFTFNGRKFCE